ncbi:hypothetical protein E4U30_008000 [Claviceps sp. LM220 group G6]|nr:hypothetical protein E4U15_006258 [Claviceps sp. LM218 group G6]KAG6090758.1 hypothetical protein E4U30_008000 [Claviceps sp. LM220 group G6]KAG6093057.1 hypothetical protein E4U14_000415 [Claviceps sp. LM454 group G7]KAG6094821.1 hypothetical protein E4U31_006142 [Claviceps sp. LM219 group G6]
MVITVDWNCPNPQAPDLVTTDFGAQAARTEDSTASPKQLVDLADSEIFQPELYDAALTATIFQLQKNRTYDISQPTAGRRAVSIAIAAQPASMTEES